MPAAYKRCVEHVKATDKSKDSAHAICTSVNAGNVRQVRQAEFKKRHPGKDKK
jgi:hypothetical protein